MIAKLILDVLSANHPSCYCRVNDGQVQDALRIEEAVVLRIYRGLVRIL